MVVKGSEVGIGWIGSSCSHHGVISSLARGKEQWIVYPEVKIDESGPRHGQPLINVHVMTVSDPSIIRLTFHSKKLSV